MSIRTRKLIGTIACFVFLTLYCLVAMAIGGAYVTAWALPLQLIFFVIAGLAWLPVLMWLIRWMQSDPPIKPR